MQQSPRFCMAFKDSPHSDSLRQAAPYRGLRKIGSPVASRSALQPKVARAIGSSRICTHGRGEIGDIVEEQHGQRVNAAADLPVRVATKVIEVGSAGATNRLSRRLLCSGGWWGPGRRWWQGDCLDTCWQQHAVQLHERPACGGHVGRDRGRRHHVRPHDRHLMVAAADRKLQGKGKQCW